MKHAAHCVLVAGLVVTAALGGCQQTQYGAKSSAASTSTAVTTPTQPTAKGNIEGISIDHDAWSSLGYTLDWAGYPFAPNHKVPVRSATFLGSWFAVQDQASEVAILDVTNGERRWGSILSNPLTKFVGVARDSIDPSRILVSSESEGYFLASGTGALVAKADYAKVVNTKPLVAGRYAIFGTSRGEVFAHDISNNLRGWGFGTPGSIEANLIPMNDGAFGVVNQSGDVYVLTTGGQLIGRNKILGPVATDPVTDGSTLFVAGTDQSVWAFASNGSLAWRYRTSRPLTLQPTYWNGMLLVTVPGEGMVALDATTGTHKWTAKDTSGTALAFRDGKLLVRTQKGIDALNHENGSRTASVDLPGIGLVVAESFENSAIYALSPSGVVARLRTR